MARGDRSGIRGLGSRHEPIVTPNPTIDGAAEADQMRPIHKVRTTNGRCYPGDGGVNVARVLAELGSPATAVPLAGGLVTFPLIDPRLG